jgi:uncharacterized protein YbjQ (UPF0145 family)
MIVTTTDGIEGKRIVEVRGLVMGNAVRARAIGRDIVAALRNVVGGETPEYTRLLAEARQEALRRMEHEAEAAGSNAVVGLRFTTSSALQGASEMLAYGTAVVVE